MTWETGQGGHDIKRMRARSRLRGNADATGWSAEKQQASEEALLRAQDDAMHRRQVRVFSLLHT